MTILINSILINSILINSILINSILINSILINSIGIQMESRIKSGALVPDTAIVRLIRNELVTRGWLSAEPYTLNATSLADSSDHVTDDAATVQPHSNDPSASFILDGFPRTAAQAAQLDTLVPINFVVHLRTPEPLVLARIGHRWLHEPSGRVYNTTFNPPAVPGRDDLTGELLTRRPDDDAATWRTRLRTFEAAATPLLAHYDRQGLLWTVDGDSSDDISPQLFQEIERRFGVSA